MTVILITMTIAGYIEIRAFGARNLLICLTLSLTIQFLLFFAVLVIVDGQQVDYEVRESALQHLKAVDDCSDDYTSFPAKSYLDQLQEASSAASYTIKVSYIHLLLVSITVVPCVCCG